MASQRRKSLQKQLQKTAGNKDRQKSIGSEGRGRRTVGKERGARYLMLLRKQTVTYVRY